MDDADPPELVARVRPRAGLALALVSTVLGTALFALGLVQLLQGQWDQILWMLFGSGMVVNAWHSRRVRLSQPGQVRVAADGLSLGGGDPLPWAEIAELRWRPAGAPFRQLGAVGRCRLLTESQRRFSERTGLLPTRMTLPLGGLDHTPAEILEAAGRHSPRLAGGVGSPGRPGC